MFTDLMSLDKPIGATLVRPFFLAGIAVAVLLGGFGVVVGLVTMAYSVPIGLFVAALGACLGAAIFLGTRIAAEAATFLFRLRAGQTTNNRVA